MMKMDFLYLSLYKILKMIVFILPNYMVKILIKKIAKIVFYLDKKHRKIIDTNLSLCFDMDKIQRNKLSLKIYENFAKFGIDFINNQNATIDTVLKKVKVENEEFIDELIKSKRVLIFTTAHFSNWELIPLTYAARFGAISIVGRTLDSKIMDKIVSKNRTQFNIELIDKKGGIRKMLQAIKNKRALGILTDQHASDNESIELEFFGKKVEWQVGASVLAKKTEALLIPAFIYQFDENTYHIKTFEPMDASIHSREELTKYQAKCCEEMIRFKPDEYFFFHKRFKKFYQHLYDK